MKTIFSDAPPLGTIVTAAFLNALQAHRHDGGDADGCAPSNYAVDSGAANAYVIALSPVLISHTVGLPISFKAGHTNTGASTFNSGPGAIAIKKNVSVALAAGDIVAGQIYTVIYDGTNYQIFGGFFVSSDNFASSLGASGYQKLPGGLIIQWGTATLPNSGSNVSTIQVSFPIPFPAALVFAVAFPNGTVNSSLGYHPILSYGYVDLSGVNFFGDSNNTGIVFNHTCPILYFALGY